MNRIFACFMMAMLAYVAAHSATRTVDLDELRYTVDDATLQASVTGVTSQYNSAAAELVIPSVIEDNGQEYTVYEISATAFPTTLPAKLVIPGTVVSLLPKSTECGAFYKRDGLKEVVFLPGDMVRLPDYIFHECATLERVTLPENFKIIGKGAFKTCTNLREIDLTNIEEIGERAFTNDRSLAHIDIPNIRTLGDYAFGLCYYGPQYIKLSDYITVIPRECFEYSQSITLLDIPDQVEELKEWSFFNCSGLKRIILGLNLKTMGSSWGVWGTIDALEYVVALPNTPPQNTPPQSKSRCPLYVPLGLKAVYTKAWSKNFSDIREIVTIDYNDGGGVFLNGRLLMKADSYDEFADEANNLTLVARPFEGASLKAIYVNETDVTEQYLADGGLSLYFREPTAVRVEFEDGTGSGGKTPTTLTVLADGHHTVDLSYNVGDTPTVNLTPLEGWRLHSLSFNGEECTPQSRSFTTPPLSSDRNELVAVYVQDGPSTDSADILNDDMRLTVNGRQVTISNKDTAQPVGVYDLDGRRVVYTYDSRFEIPASVSVALIKVGERTYKVALR